MYRDGSMCLNKCDEVCDLRSMTSSPLQRGEA